MWLGPWSFVVGAVNPTSKPETESAVLNARIDWILSQNHWESVMRIENINSGCLDMPQSHHAQQRQRLDILVVTNSFNTQASFSNQRHEMGSKHGLPLSQRWWNHIYHIFLAPHLLSPGRCALWRRLVGIASECFCLWCWAQMCGSGLWQGWQ